MFPVRQLGVPAVTSAVSVSWKQYSLRTQRQQFPCSVCDVLMLSFVCGPSHLGQKTFSAHGSASNGYFITQLSRQLGTAARNGFPELHLHRTRGVKQMLLLQKVYFSTAKKKWFLSI